MRGRGSVGACMPATAGSCELVDVVLTGEEASEIVEALLAASDAALYVAKTRGRGRVAELQPASL